MRLEILGADEVTAEAELETSAATRTSAPSSVAKANVRFMCVLSCPGGGGDARADCREKGTHVYRRCPRREESVPWVECPPKSAAERTWLARLKTRARCVDLRGVDEHSPTRPEDDEPGADVVPLR